MINEKLSKKIKTLHSQQIPYSPRDELVCTISKWVHNSIRSLIPNRSLELAQSHLEVYEQTPTADKDLVEGLWEVIENAWDLYSESEARN